MRVRAIQDCFVDNKLRKAGTEFEISDGQQFSLNVMMEVEDEAPVEKPVAKVAKVAKKAAKKAKKAPAPTEES